MGIEQVKQQVQQLPPQIWQELFSWMVNEERLRREQESAKAEVIQQLQEAGTIPAPDYGTTRDSADAAPEWVNPGTDHTKMYPQGAVITHNGKTWRSVTSNLNSWEPGTENGLTWAEVVLPDVEPAEGEELAGETVPYQDNRQYEAGVRVNFNGEIYESTAAHFAASGWTPINAHAYWKKAA